MSDNNNDTHERTLLNLNEYVFYNFMPDSETKKNDLGYFLKNKSIETYSYVTPTLYGEENFDQFIDFAFSFFSDGKEYFIVKHFNDELFMVNSKKLRLRKLMPYNLDTLLMVWKENKDPIIQEIHSMELEQLNSKTIIKWVDVFFDSFKYPRYLRKYITRMVNTQEENGIEFYIGYVSGNDVSCFCSFKSTAFHGLYGVGTREKFRRQGYAKTMMTVFMEEKLKEDSNAQFCLQAQKNSGAEKLYLGLDFKTAYIQKRFDWDPSFKDSSF